jgi:hypothetical protein
MLTRVIFLAAFLITAEGFVLAQKSGTAPDMDKGARSSSSGIMTGTPEEEMLARAEVRAAEKERAENLDRAREAAQLSTEIRDSYARHKVFSRTEIKKLERLEKITRRIRSEAGGSDGEVTIDDPPREVEQALARLAEISEKMRQVVEKTSRYVVNATVIERANEALEMMRYLRTFSH